MLALFASPQFAGLGYAAAKRLGWRPLVIVSAAASASSVMTLASAGGSNRTVENSISTVFLKDPTDPRWRDDPAVELYRTVMARYAKGANVRDVQYVHGMAAAYEAVRVMSPERAVVLLRKAAAPSASSAPS